MQDKKGEMGWGRAKNNKRAHRSIILHTNIREKKEEIVIPDDR